MEPEQQCEGGEAEADAVSDIDADVATDADAVRYAGTEAEADADFVTDAESVTDADIVTDAGFVTDAEANAGTGGEAEAYLSPVGTEPSPSGNPETETPGDFAPIQAILESVGQIEGNISSIADSSAKTAAELHDLHRLYHNEFAGRLKSMQDELERYREIDKGRAFDGILLELAKLYCDNESLPDGVTDAKVKKRIGYMLMDVAQILEAYGVQRQKSSPGDKRNPRYCQVIERIPTCDPELNETVFQSRSTGFFVENRALVKELIDVYLYTEKTDCGDAQCAPISGEE